ncbi:MAG: sugar transferase [Sulfurovum sp.]|nr:sugar transferase [Sulfurovum sp.]
MLTSTDKIQKRLFDIVLSVVGICMTWWLMLLAWIVASVDTKSNGLFMQARIGKEGEPFLVFKIKTMNLLKGVDTTVTTSRDSRITKTGVFFRKTKIDELPQLFNVLFGSMSFVGPRPDVPGFADTLEADDRIILSLRPGITGPASLKYKDEEELLSKQDDPERYNKEVIWTDKVQINKTYIKEWSLKKDIIYIIKTVLG